ncbi:hypothetical protein ACFWY5_29855 [Nonomuraea sp. NPDC059007]|uniref:hypothetical protein n=1 Tax=Nonomuraea sp. NPDC059007 TaxID=3346692 RepID=UPI00369DF78F
MPPVARPGVSPFWDLSTGSDGIYVLPGAKGFDAPPVQFLYDEMPALDGAYMRHTRRESRELFVPIYFEAPDRGGLLTLKRQLLASLDASRGPGKLKLVEGDGSSRYINAYCVSGPEGDEGKDQSGFVWAKYGLIFRALDPFFYSGTSVEVNFTAGDLELKPFFAGPNVPFLGRPLINRTHSLNGNSRVTITGDVDTWPSWHIHGPASDIEFIRQVPDAPDQRFMLNLSLTASQSIIIETQPGRKSVRDRDTGENLWRHLGPNPALWPISPGVNDVTLNVNNVGAETVVTMAYTPRYLSA